MAYRITTRMRLVPVAAVAAALLVGTASFASAQTTSAQTMSPAPAAPAGANGSLQQTHNAWRSTKLDGATVYNDQGNSIGTIDDMLLDSSGNVSNVVLSVGGFLGVDSKYVEVPFNKLKFEANKGNASSHDYSVVLPGATKDSLKSMSGFSY